MRPEGKPRKTYIPQIVVDHGPHLANFPLDDIAKVLVVDVVVLFADRTLCALLELVLPITKAEKKQLTKRCQRKNKRGTYTFTRESLDRTAMTLFNSFGCNPILPARSSSLRLEAVNGQL